MLYPIVFLDPATSLQNCQQQGTPYKDDLLHFYLSLLHRQSEQVSIIHEMGWIPCCSNRRTLYHNLWTRPAFPMWIERGQ